jgi:hypothetical protein
MAHRAADTPTPQRKSAMLYLKNGLGGLGRTLHDSAVHSFHGPHRWWKLALYAVIFVLPGGTVAVLLFTWFDHRRNDAAGGRADVDEARPTAGAAAPVPSACGPRADAPSCRASAGRKVR